MSSGVVVVRQLQTRPGEPGLHLRSLVGTLILFHTWARLAAVKPCIQK